MPASPKSARTEKSSTLFAFDIESSRDSTSAFSHHKSSYKTRTSVENKENFRADISHKKRENANSSSCTSSTSNANRKEKRSFKCERLSNIFSREVNNSINSPGSCHNNANISKEKQAIESSSRRINSAPVYRKHSKQTPDSNDEPTSSSDLTMFPFDREAIDYERIQRECFAVEEAHADDYNARKNFNYQYDVYDSPTYEMLDQKIGIFQQYAIISRHENERKSKKKKSDVQSPKNNSSWGMLSPLKNIEQINRKLNETSLHEQPTTSSNLPSPIPDLKIDFFAESPSLMASSRGEQRTENESKLDDCQKQTSSFASKNNTTLVSSSVFTAASNTSSNANINGSINLTSNPMSSVCTPRATIVVQQVRRHAIFIHNFIPQYFLRVHEFIIFSRDQN